MQIKAGCVCQTKQNAVLKNMFVPLNVPVIVSWVGNCLLLRLASYCNCYLKLFLERTYL